MRRATEIGEEVAFGECDQVKIPLSERCSALRKMTVANGCTPNEAQVALEKANELPKFVMSLPDRYRPIRDPKTGGITCL
jgi:hypothetical protein